MVALRKPSERLHPPLSSQRPFPVLFRALFTAWALALCLSPGARAADEPRFPLLEFVIEGNSVLSVMAVERAVMPFLGPDKSIADVDAARAALERVYQQAGYLTVFVDVPEQRVAEGAVVLKVVEGRVEKLSVSGSRYFSQGYIRKTASEVAVGQVPNFNRMQEQLAELNRTEDRRVQPVLKPGQAPGTVDVDLKVSDRFPADATIELNNRHSTATEPWRLSASAHYNNLWQRGHSVGFTAITAPQNTSQSRLLLLNYSAPLPAEATLSTYLVSSNSLVEPVSAVTVAGKGLNLGLRYLRPLPALDGFNHSLSLGVDYKDFNTRTVDTNSGVLTPLRYLPFQISYTAAWQEAGRQTLLNTQLNFAQGAIFRREVTCADAGPADQFACSTKDGDGTYAYWRGELRHAQPVWGRSTISARLGWQLAVEPLVSNERYSLGGADSVRGYLEAEASGDRALTASLEWRSSNLAGAGATWPLDLVDEATAAAFFDAGEVRVLNALPGQAWHTSRSGIGLGLQWRAARRVSGGLDLAWPRDVTSDNPSRKPRLHVRLAYSL